MLHYLRIAVTALSLTACVLLIALWVSSTQKPMLFYHFSDTRHVEVWSCQGKVLFNSGVSRVVVPVKETASRQRLYDFKKSLYETERHHVIQSGACPIPDTNSFGFKWLKWNHFVIPYWFPIVLTATLALIPWFKRRFSLRTLLIATTLVAMVLGVIVAVS